MCFGLYDDLILTKKKKKRFFLMSLNWNICRHLQDIQVERSRGLLEIRISAKKYSQYQKYRFLELETKITFTVMWAEVSRRRGVIAKYYT